MINSYIRELTCAIIMQAVRDYFADGATDDKQRMILRELRSEWMDYITNGTSVVVAEQLEKNPKEIKARLRKENVK